MSGVEIVDAAATIILCGDLIIRINAHIPKYPVPVETVGDGRQEELSLEKSSALLLPVAAGRMEGIL